MIMRVIKDGLEGLVLKDLMVRTFLGHGVVIVNHQFITKKLYIMLILCSIVIHG